MINGADLSKIGYKGNDSLCADYFLGGGGGFSIIDQPNGVSKINGTGLGMESDS